MFSLLFSWRGRINREKFIPATIGVSLVFVLLYKLFGDMLFKISYWAGMIFVLFFIYIKISLIIKRGHDFNLSGVVSTLLLLVLITDVVYMLIPGTDGENRYDPQPPKEPQETPQPVIAEIETLEVSDKVTALMQAVLDGDTYAIPSIVHQYPQEINTRYKKTGATALWAACWNNKEDIVKILLQVEGIDVNIPNNAGISPLEAAKEKGAKEIINMLELHNAR